MLAGALLLPIKFWQRIDWLLLLLSFVLLTASIPGIDVQSTVPDGYLKLLRFRVGIRQAVFGGLCRWLSRATSRRCIPKHWLYQALLLIGLMVLLLQMLTRRFGSHHGSGHGYDFPAGVPLNTLSIDHRLLGFDLCCGSLATLRLDD